MAPYLKYGSATMKQNLLTTISA